MATAATTKYSAAKATIRSTAVMETIHCGAEPEQIRSLAATVQTFSSIITGTVLMLSLTSNRKI